MTDEEIYHYLDLVELKDDIEKFPLGLNTFVGENGQNISGGQKQRIAIARALALKPEVIIFDEATSNLDPLTERRICNNLKQLHITQIVVTHRLNALPKTILWLLPTPLTTFWSAGDMKRHGINMNLEQMNGLIPSTFQVILILGIMAGISILLIDCLYKKRGE